MRTRKYPRALPHLVRADAPARFRLRVFDLFIVEAAYARAAPAPLAESVPPDVNDAPRPLHHRNAAFAAYLDGPADVLNLAVTFRPTEAGIPVLRAWALRQQEDIEGEVMPGQAILQSRQRVLWQHPALLRRHQPSTGELNALDAQLAEESHLLVG